MDMVASAIATEPHLLDEMRQFYRDALGFEEQFFCKRDDASGLGLFSYGPSFFYIGTPGFLSLIPNEVSQGCMAMIRVPHSATLRDVIAARCKDSVGPLIHSDLFGLDKESLETRLATATTATSEASGLKAGLISSEPVPRSESNSMPVSALQIFTVPSMLVVAKRRPSKL